jgi:hypothetical protein
MPISTEAQGIFRDPVVQANVEMLKLALINLALAGIKVEITAEDGWHKGEMWHIGDQLIDGRCDAFKGVETEEQAAQLDLEIYARETVEVAPPDYITQDLDPRFQKLAPTVQELRDRGILDVPDVSRPGVHQNWN